MAAFGRLVGLFTVTSVLCALIYWASLWEPPPPPEPPVITVTLPVNGHIGAAQTAIAFANLPNVRNFAGPYLAARFAQNAGDWAAASAYMQWAVQAGPRDPALAEHAMILAAGSGSLDQAARMARKALNAGSTSPLPHLVLGGVLMAEGDEDAAQAALSSAGKSGFALPKTAEPPDLAQALLDNAGAFLSSGQSDGARVLSQLARALEPGAAVERQATALVGQIHADAGRDDLALSYFQAVGGGLDEVGTFARQACADLLVRLGRTTEAVATLEALAAEATDPAVRAHALTQAGEAERVSGRWDAAVASYDRAGLALREAEVGPEAQGSLLFLRAVALDGAGRWAEAEETLKEALTLAPDNPEILNYLGYSWVDRGLHLDKARAMLERAVAARPDDHHIVDSLGWALFRLGDWAGAVAQLEEAASLAPYNAVVADHLGDAYWRAGRRAEARFQWRRALNYSDDEALKAQIESKLRLGLPE
ncbi:MAG TPA: hypothetical protein DDX54_07190 [Rhodospirillaceae bacterium]|jgi:tetratricopeptide (TPR) repeat protein|nr:tetratricopeptide repeat protein [Alphaproteobacteria bacterium]HBH27158.1 hypothetical protein [Rhodospirillaceae bacterium]